MLPPTDLPAIVLSLGDAAGIGPEVILKAVSSPEVKSICRPLLLGPKKVFQPLISSLKLKIGIAEVLEPEDIPLRLPEPGKVDPEWADLAMRCVRRAVRLVETGPAAALVTAPINKEGIHLAGYHFQGHTDYLAHLTGATDYAMMLVGGPVRVVLATVHVPLSQVSSLLTTPGIAAKIRLAAQVLRRLSFSHPRVVVAGLNPHAGEAGAFGREEFEVITPAVRLCREEGINVEGPLPPDTLFYHLYHGRYDVAVVMYHDQGLIPLKMVAFAQGVNLTLGLPIIRTSPDHGTAYDLAGLGKADPRSMIEAIKLACRLASSSFDHD